VNGKLIVGAMTLGQPERLVTLTQVGDEWQTIRNRVRQLVYRIRSDGVAFEWAWAVERNPKGTGHHVHGVQWGSFVRQSRLSALAGSVGMGRVADVRRLGSAAGGSRYPLKALAGTAYTMKGAQEGREHLLRNGGRLVHASRGFWRDSEGRPVPGVREAVKLALRASYGDTEASRWVLAKEGQLGRAAVERVSGGWYDAA
jgi:hypothetical protein